MITIHAAALIRTVSAGGEPLLGSAVVVEGGRIAAVGPLDEVVAAYPRARVRDWRGTLGPALVWEGPVPDAPSPRERVHELLKRGAAAVLASRVTDPELREAVGRSGLTLVHETRPGVLSPGSRADLAVFTADGACLATVLAGRLVHRRA